jgi:WD40 repeat protein
MWMQKLNTRVAALAYSPDSKTLYSLDRGGRLRSWDIAARTGRVLEYSGAVQDPEPYGRSLCALTDGNRLVVFASSLCVVEAATGAVRRRAVPSGVPRYGQARLTTDGRLLAVRADGRAITTWDVPSHQPGPLLHEWPPRLGLTAFDCSPDGRTLAVLERRGHVAVLDLPSGELRCRFHPAVEKESRWPLRLSRNGNTLVVHTRNHLEVWDVSSTAVQVARMTSALPDTALAIHPTAPLAVSADRGRSLALFHLRTGEPLRSFDLRLGEKLTCVVFSPDGLTCAAGGSSGRFAVFDVDV